MGDPVMKYYGLFLILPLSCFNFNADFFICPGSKIIMIKNHLL